MLLTIIYPNLMDFEEDADDNPYHKKLLQGHDHAVRALAARGRTLVSGSYDCSIRVWDIITGQAKLVLTGHTQKGLCASIEYISTVVLKCHSIFVCWK